MSTIALRAGVSKGTLYNYFPSKEDLFEASIRVYGQEAVDSVFILDPATDAIDRELFALGKRYLLLLLRPDVLAVARVVIGEATKFPPLARAFFETGPQQGVLRLADWLRSLHGKGLLDVPEPERAAAQFLMLCRSDVWLRGILGLEIGPLEPAADRVVAAATDLFLKGYRRTPR